MSQIPHGFGLVSGPEPEHVTLRWGGVIHVCHHVIFLFAATVIEEGSCTTRGGGRGGFREKPRDGCEGREKENGLEGGTGNMATKPKGLKGSEGSEECVHVQ